MSEQTKIVRRPVQKQKEQNIISKNHPKRFWKNGLMFLFLIGLSIPVLFFYSRKIAANIPESQFPNPTSIIQTNYSADRFRMDSIPSFTPTLTQQGNDTMETIITPAPTFFIPKPQPSATITPAPTLAPTKPPEEAYQAQTGSPFYISAVDIPGGNHSCLWFGIGGQIFDFTGKPTQGVKVVVRGDIKGKAVSLASTSGSAIDYGPGGYEIRLGLKPQTTEQTLSIQLIDVQGQPLSPQVGFNTVNSCEKNLVIVNFIQRQ